MRLIFLGTGGSVVTPSRHTPGVYLPDHGILFDGGSNVFSLRELHGDGPLTVLMSHYHADHSVGLYALSAGIFFGREPQPEISVYGPAQAPEFLATCGEDRPLWPIPLPFSISTAPDAFRFGEIEVRTCPVPHAGPTLAYRLTLPGGESLAFVTDTTAPGNYVEFIRGVDVLIHECAFPNAREQWAHRTRHSSAGAVGRLARQAGVGLLYLMHLGPLSDGPAVLDEVRAEFSNTVLPVEGLEYPRSVSVDPRRAIFPGSFDPLTVGHLDIIDTCRGMFTEVTVVVAMNPTKDSGALFTPEERVELIRACVPESVRVDSWSGLTVEYARHRQAGCIVRGLGRAEDYFGEIRLWKTNALLEPEIRTVWVPPRAQNLDVSSSMIKEAAMFGGWEGVRHLVPEPIRALVGQRAAAARERD